MHTADFQITKDLGMINDLTCRILQNIMTLALATHLSAIAALVLLGRRSYTYIYAHFAHIRISSFTDMLHTFEKNRDANK